MVDKDEEVFDGSFLKDLADIIKNKTLFFIPFFGALLAFLFTKSDYIKGSNAIIWLLLTALLGSCIRYIQLVSQLLWVIESMRFVFNVRKMGSGAWPTWEEGQGSISAFAEACANPHDSGRVVVPQSDAHDVLRSVPRAIRYLLREDSQRVYGHAVGEDVQVGCQPTPAG